MFNIMSNPMMMQAMGAMMRGESPSTFLKNLANSNPQLQGLDLDNLEGTWKFYLLLMGTKSKKTKTSRIPCQ